VSAQTAFGRGIESNLVWYDVDDAIVLVEDDDSSASEVEVENVSVRAVCAPNAGFLSSLESAVESLAAPSQLDGWYDIDEFSEPAPRLRRPERDASTADSLQSPSRLSSESPHDRIGVEGLDMRRARSESTLKVT